MYRRLLLAGAVAVVFAQLIACAPATYQKTDTDVIPTLAMATETWQQTSVTTLPAIEDLMQQADKQIADSNWEVASEKLERALRISPDYAPAWSRLHAGA